MLAHTSSPSTRPMSPELLFDMSPDTESFPISVLSDPLDQPLLYAFPTFSRQHLDRLRSACRTSESPRRSSPMNDLIVRPQWPRRNLAPSRSSNDENDENRGRTGRIPPLRKSDGHVHIVQDRAFSPAPRARGRRLTPAPRRSSLTTPYQTRPVLRQQQQQQQAVSSVESEKYLFRQVEQEKAVEVYHYPQAISSLRVSLHG